jgi:hypothetical protein
MRKALLRKNDGVLLRIMLVHVKKSEARRSDEQH